jgi:nitroreductase
MKPFKTFVAVATLLAINFSAMAQTTSQPKCCGENQVISSIMNRRSIRAYKDTPVEREKLQTIVNCGINAPSGMNQQPWQVRVVDNAEWINGITAIFKAKNERMASDPSFKNMFRNAPAVIFIASPANGAGQIDCGLLGENMILAAQSLGLGTCCLGGPIAFMKNDADAAPYVAKLQIPEDYTLLYAIAVGYPDEAPDAKPRDTAKVLFIE